MLTCLFFIFKLIKMKFLLLVILYYVKKLAKINQELSTESDLAFSYSVLPKPDANNFLTINGMLVDNARSIKNYSRIGASKIKFPKTGSVEE